MLLTCSSCNSKYLVNSADLKPNGRNVKCAACGHNWFQKPNLVQEEILNLSDPSSLNVDNNQLKQNKNTSYSLPSTYIKEQKVSIVNSFLIVFILVILVIGIWFIKREGLQIIILLNFYVQEFYFNLKLIITDLAKLINQIIN